MTQNQITSTDIKVGQNWKAHPIEQDVFINTISNEHVQRHYAKISQGQQIIFQKRMQETHPSIVKVKHLHILKNNTYSNDNLVYVYTDRALPINRVHWVPVNSSLTVLKGFRRLSSLHGWMRVTQKMISMNERGQLKLWINENPVFNQITAKAVTQQQMLADIIRIVMNYDSETGGLLVGCKTINEAINNILVSLAQPKNSSQYSQRAKQEKYGKFQFRQQNVQYKSDRNKEKRNEQTWKNNSDPRKVNNGENLRTQPNYLQNVHIVKSPKYLQNFQDLKVPEKLQFQRKGTPHRFITQSSTNNQMKVKSIQFNNSNPTNKVNYLPKNSPYSLSNETSWESQDKFIRSKGYQMQGQVFTPSNYNTNYQNQPYRPEFGNRNYQKPQEKNQEILNDRKSDLHQEFIRGENGRVSQFPHFIQNRRKIQQNKKIPEDLKKKYQYKEENPRIQAKEKQIARTRTQDFTHVFPNQNSWNSYAKSPKNYQNANFSKQDQFLNTKKDGLKQYQTVSQKNISPSKHQQQASLQLSKKFSSIHSSKGEGKSKNGKQSHENSQKIEKPNVQEKKLEKQQLAKQLKMQFNSLLTPSQIKQNKERERGPEDKDLLNAKSSKDLLIKQKVEKKKATFAELKSQAIKILNDPLF